MKPSAQVTNDRANSDILYMAFDLGQSKWNITFGNGLKMRQFVMESANLPVLYSEVIKAKEKLKLTPTAQVVSCYEAGRDGFWLHRELTRSGIENYVVDSSGIEVDRRARRVKTDKLDADRLLKQLIRFKNGETRALRVLHIPSEEAEDARNLHREREILKRERTQHTNRIKSFLNLHGIKCGKKSHQSWGSYLDETRDWASKPLPPHQKEELLRETARLELLEKQLKIVVEKMLPQEKPSETEQLIEQLSNLCGIGDISAWILVKEWFGWRKFRNRREVGAAAGLVSSPYSSGSMQREQGISKSGNKRIRWLMLQLAWSWTRYQPDSELSKWYRERFSQNGRLKKIGIVALARRLLIMIWRYLEKGVLPQDVALKSA